MAEERTRSTPPADDAMLAECEHAARNHADIKRVALLRPRECARALGVSTTTLWRWSRDAAMNFPRAFRLGQNSVAFGENDVVACLESRRAAPRRASRRRDTEADCRGRPTA